MEMKWIKGRQKKGILLTLLMLIIFILMISELVSYVLTNISYNEIATRTSIAINTAAFSTALTSGIASDMQYSLYAAMQKLYSQGIPISNSPYGNNVAIGYLYSMVYNGTADGVTYNSMLNSSIVNYVPAMEKHASVLGFGLKIINPSLRVYENGTWSISSEYTALAIINSSSGTFTYPIRAVATVPLSGITAEYIMPLTFTNYQDVATATPFQQILQINSSKYARMEASNLDNIEFIYQNGTVIPSWLESGASNSSDSSVYWLKLNGIPANGYKEVYMVFANPSRNMFNRIDVGEAPQLSSAYAEYDDGASVFNNYWNFNGTTMPSGFTEYTDGGGIASVHNGLYLSLSGGSCSPPSYMSFVYDTPISASGTIIETYSNGTRTAGPTDLGIYTGNSDSAGGYGGVANTWGWGSGTIAGGYGNIGNPFDISSGSGVASMYWIGEGDEAIGWNYDFVSSTNNAETYSNSLYMAIGTGHCTGGSVMNYYWLRTRAYPPNGIMPATSIGSPSLYVS